MGPSGEERKPLISGVFCGEALASTESTTSGQSATSQCLSALPGRLGRGKFVLDGLGWRIRTSAPITPIQRLPGYSASLGVIDTAVTRGRKEFHSRGGVGDQSPSLKKDPRKKPQRENRLGRGPKFPHGKLHLSHVLTLGFKL